MSDQEITADVRAFVHGNIPSVGHMEALVLTMEEPGPIWTVADVARRLFISEAKAGAILRDLATAGLVDHSRSPEQWRFAPRDEAFAELAARAGRLYRQRLVAMTGVIRSGTDAGRQIADAFRFRKE